MKKYRVYVNYYVDCKAKGYVDIEASSTDEAMDMAENGEGEIENTELEEDSITGDIEVVDAEEL